ncbi:MAG: M23 family metallopeptidase [Ruminococcaceae bacterium]|nr:M23 family metallopeptidase [Oscillospiraceae bacterium]
MSDKFKNSKFYKAMQNPKVSRAVYIGTVLTLVAVAIVIGVVAASNRTKKPTEDPAGTTNPPSVTNTPSTSETPTTSDTPTEDTPSSTTNQSGTVSKPLPSFILPTSGKVDKQHNADTQVFSDTMNDYRIHLGIDITTTEGAPVYAAAEGTVKKIWSDPLMGYCVAISHDGDAVTVYKNLAKDLAAGITEGASVKAGQQIASVGNSAMVEVAEEPHLHLEMTVGGLLVDPLKYFSAKDVASLGVDQSYGE